MESIEVVAQTFDGPNKFGRRNPGFGRQSAFSPAYKTLTAPRAHITPQKSVDHDSVAPHTVISPNWAAASAGAPPIQSRPKPGLHCAVLDASDDVVCLAERREPPRRAPGSTRGRWADAGLRVAAAAAPRPGQCIHRCWNRCRGCPGSPARCPAPGLAYTPRWRGLAPHPWGTGLPAQACWSLVRRRRRPPGRPRSRPRIPRQE